ncbi:MAG TPA: sulfatase-like hydrolase/transferase, partial [Pirellulales bacterium]|nr:sulfatase-like hydrolase/transferase [Pirellulales bacterium]
MKRMFAALVVAWLGAMGAAESEAAERPNVLILLADDLGWRDVPWHGCEYVMPNLDALGKQSLRLESHYVHPLCSPTRAALLSGRYASR